MDKIKLSKNKLGDNGINIVSKHIYEMKLRNCICGAKDQDINIYFEKNSSIPDLQNIIFFQNRMNLSGNCFVQCDICKKRTKSSFLEGDSLKADQVGNLIIHDLEDLNRNFYKIYSSAIDNWNKNCVFQEENILEEENIEKQNNFLTDIYQFLFKKETINKNELNVNQLKEENLVLKHQTDLLKQEIEISKKEIIFLKEEIEKLKQYTARKR